MAIHKIMEPPKITPPRQKLQSAAGKVVTGEEKPEKMKAPVWDCGSSLYDSFELKSFEKQLDSAINSRSLSMPHLSDRRVDFVDVPKPAPAPVKKPSRISRSIQRLLRSVFKVKSNTASFFSPEKDGFYVVYEKSGVLTTIPETPEMDTLSPEMKALVRRTASDRFVFTPVGISCVQ